VRRIFPVESTTSAHNELNADALDAAYAFPVSRERWVRANFVTSLDGGVAVGGVSRPLSSETDRALFRVLRGLADAVMVGAGTARAEGYKPAKPLERYAEARQARAVPSAPPIVVVSRSLDLDWSSHLINDPDTILLTCSDAPDIAKARERMTVIECGTSVVDLRVGLDELATRGLRRIVCEGGPTLLSSLVAAECLDEMCQTISPHLTGHGPRLLAGLEGIRTMKLVQVLEEDDALFTRYVRDDATDVEVG
jgi:riboflavin biosynthesis pyrimidine reductase